MLNNIGNVLDLVMFFLEYVHERMILVGSHMDNILSSSASYNSRTVYNIYGSEMDH